VVDESAEEVVVFADQLGSYALLATTSEEPTIYTTHLPMVVTGQ
jgi:hypothetical protein